MLILPISSIQLWYYKGNYFTLCMPWRDMVWVELWLHFLNQSTRWRSVVGFILQLLYFWVNRPWCPLNRKLGGPQRTSGYFGEGQNLLPCQETKPRLPHSLETTLTVQSHLPFIAVYSMHVRKHCYIFYSYDSSIRHLRLLGVSISFGLSHPKKHAASGSGSFGKDRKVPFKLGLSETAFLKQRATDITYVPLYMHLHSVFRWKVL